MQMNMEFEKMKYLHHEPSKEVLSIGQGENDALPLIKNQPANENKDYE